MEVRSRIAFFEYQTDFRFNVLFAAVVERFANVDAGYCRCTAVSEANVNSSSTATALYQSGNLQLTVASYGIAGERYAACAERSSIVNGEFGDITRGTGELNITVVSQCGNSVGFRCRSVDCVGINGVAGDKRTDDDCAIGCRRDNLQITVCKIRNINRGAGSNCIEQIIRTVVCHETEIGVCVGFAVEREYICLGARIQFRNLCNSTIACLNDNAVACSPGNCIVRNCN